MTSLTHTSEQLINKTAALLGKFVPGEALGSVEHDTIDGCIDDVLEEISKIVVVDRDNIPNKYFEVVARLLAIYAAAEFSNTTLDLGAVFDHEQRLRYLVANSPTYEILKSNFF
jgi:hypothetical protein